MFDAIHESFHTGQRPDVSTLEVIEADETSLERRNSNEDIAASQFAGDVTLNGRAGELAQIAVKAAQNSVERLKRVVPEVAQREGVAVVRSPITWPSACLGRTSIGGVPPPICRPTTPTHGRRRAMFSSNASLSRSTTISTANFLNVPCNEEPMTEFLKPPPLDVHCTSSDCENDLHCFKQLKKMMPDERGRCRACGADLVDWNCLHKRDLDDAAHTFEALQHELIRHHFFHVEIDDTAKRHAQRKGRVKLKEAARDRLAKYLAPANRHAMGAKRR